MLSNTELIKVAFSYIFGNKLKVKKTFNFIFALCVFCSCNNRPNVERTDISVFVNHDSIAREEIFEARGDTVFGNVLYGMNRNEVTQQLKQFEEEALKYSNSKGDFIFAKVHFMGIDIKDFEKNYNQDLDSYSDAFLWKDKLGAVNWKSYKLYAEKKEEIVEILNQFISFFEIKYGKPNFKKTDIKDWMDYINGAFYYLNMNVASWETSNRKISIGINWESPLGFTAINHSVNDFTYYINILFSDKKAVEEMMNYKDEQNQKTKKIMDERARQDSIKTINML